MALTRRGFLSVLSTAMVGAVVYEPKSMLWLPKTVEAYGGVEGIPTSIVSSDLSMTEIDRIVNKTGELNELALACAKRLAERLERHPGIFLREVMYRQTGHVRVEEVQMRDRRWPADRPSENVAMRYTREYDIRTEAADDIETEQAELENKTEKLARQYREGILARHEDRQVILEVEDEGKGHFETNPGRVLNVVPVSQLAQRVASSMPRRFDAASVDALTYDLADKLGGFSMFAPIGVELRPGDKFDDKMLIGTGTDPVSGLSVRVLRFEHHGQTRGPEAMWGLEVAGGWWKKGKGHAAPGRFKSARKLSL